MFDNLKWEISPSDSMLEATLDGNNEVLVCTIPRENAPPKVAVFVNREPLEGVTSIDDWYLPDPIAMPDYTSGVTRYLPPPAPVCEYFTVTALWHGSLRRVKIHIGKLDIKTNGTTMFSVELSERTEN